MSIQTTPSAMSKLVSQPSSFGGLSIRMASPMLAVVACMFLLASCTTTPKVYFSQGMRNTVKATGKTPKDLQYYVDTDIELRRELTSDTVQITRGSVVFENGKYVHVIKLKKFTPGICINYKDSARLDIAFDDTDDKFLTFGVNNATSPSSIYVIFADEWKNKRGKIIYEGKEFFISPSGADAQLMIKKNDKKLSEGKQRVMKGRTLE